MDPALASQPFAARLLQLHDRDGDGVLTQVLLAIDAALGIEHFYFPCFWHGMVDVSPVVLHQLQLSQSLLDAVSEYDPSLHNAVLQAELLAAIEMLTQLSDPVKRSACEYGTTLPDRQDLCSHVSSDQ